MKKLIVRKILLWIGVPKLLILSFVLFICMVFIGVFGVINEQELNTQYDSGGSCSITGSINQQAWSDSFQKAGVFQNKGDVFIRIAKEQGIDPVLFAAISFHETAWGTSKAVIVKNNPGGLMGKDGLMSFSSLDEGLEAMGRTLHNRIIKDGLDTLEKLGSVYAPIGAANDPTGLNNHWVPTVQNIAEKLGGLTANCSTPELAEGEFIVPILNPVVSSWYGGRDNPTGTGYKFHKGIDFAHPIGTPVMASKGGKVVVAFRLAPAGSGYGGFGNVIQIDHGDGTWTLYAHLSEMNVQEGQTVKQGDVIGKVGSTGNSTGPHLHFEIRKEILGGQVDPKPLLGL